MLLKENLMGVQHLGIPVVNITQAKSWYIKTLGFQLIYETVINSENGAIKVAFLKLEDIILELYQLPEKELEDIKTRGHGHIDHFAINVFDIIQTLCEMISRGALLDSSTPKGPIFIRHFWSKGISYVNLIGPNGEKVQLQQRLDLKQFNKNSNIDGWSHLGIIVSNIENSKAFYKRFGFKEVMKAKIKEQQSVNIIVVLEKNGFQIELIHPTNNTLEEFSLIKDGHIDHISFNVKDVEKAFQELKKSGLNVIQDKPIFLPFWEKGMKYFNILGPDGEKIEFSQKL
ncbi:MAG: VOC family protein [Clostridiaceae bacterium]